MQKICIAFVWILFLSKYKVMKGISPVIATILVVMIIVGIVAFSYTWFMSTGESGKKTTMTYISQMEKAQQKIEIGTAYQCGPDICFELRASGVNTIDIPLNEIHFYIDDKPVTISIWPGYTPNCGIGSLAPGESCYGKINNYVCINRGTLKISYWGLEESKKISKCVSKISDIKFTNTIIALVAYSTPHWVVFNFSSGKYEIYSSTDGDLTAENGPEIGTAPILENVNNYTIQTNWSNWTDRPVNSPIIIVKNPNPDSNFLFNWTDPHGSYLFYLQKINALEDFLIFWEDLYNPFNPPSKVDDWKDHVVRVSLRNPNTYRIAVFLAKGGYKHEFWLQITNATPLTGLHIYTKPHGSFESNNVSNYYYEIPGRIYTVSIS